MPAALLKLCMPRDERALGELVPSREQWNDELESGWFGSDGSTASLDDIEGVQIGEATNDYRAGLPANLHDFHYRVIRRLVALHQIDGATRRRMRAAADRRHYAGLLHAVAILVGWSGWKARRRAAIRYRALRLLGGRHVRPKDEEAYRTERDPRAARR